MNGGDGSTSRHACHAHTWPRPILPSSSAREAEMRRVEICRRCNHFMIRSISQGEWSSSKRQAEQNQVLPVLEFWANFYLLSNSEYQILSDLKKGKINDN